MSKDIFNPPDMMKPAGYSHVAKVTGGSLVYIAGQVPADASGNLVGEGNLEAQAEQVFKNLKAAVEAAGGTMADIVTVTIFVTDIKEREQVWRARQEVFTGNFPASTLVQVAALATPALKVEINAVAHIGAGQR